MSWRDDWEQVILFGTVPVKLGYLAVLFVLAPLLYGGCGMIGHSGVGDLNGVVMTTSQSPISGVRVSWAGDSKVYTITNTRGEYTLNGIEAQDTTFVYEKQGYVTVRDVVSLKRDSIIKYDVTLKTTSTIQRISVTPYSTAAYIYFETGNITRADVQYGLNSNLESLHQDFDYSRVHEITVTGLSPQTTYFYRITAASDLGNIEKSEIQSFTTLSGSPAEIPKNLYIADVYTETKATLAWDAPESTDVMGYNLYRSTHRADGFEKVNNDTIRSSYYEDYGLTQGQNYVWYVKSVNSDNLESDPSNLISMIAPGSMGSSNSLKKENNPHYLLGDLTIQRGATLEVGPGVIIYVASTDGLAQGENGSQVEISVLGALRVLGSSLDPVTLTQDPVTNPSPAASNWVGISFDPSSDTVGSSLYHARISYATTSIAATDGAVSTVGCHIRHCNVGIDLLRGDNAYLSSNTLEYCYVGIRLENASYTQSKGIDTNLFKNTEIGLVSIENRGLFIERNTFRNCTTLGARVACANGGVTRFGQNLMVEMKDIGVRTEGGVELINNTIEARTPVAVSSADPLIWNNIFLYYNPFDITPNPTPVAVQWTGNILNRVKKNIMETAFNPGQIDPNNFSEDPLLDSNYKPLPGSPALAHKGENGPYGDDIGRFN